MKFSKEEILRFIIASKILDQYLRQNSELENMIKDVEDSNIHFSEEYIPTISQREIIDRRIKHGKLLSELPISNIPALEKVKAFIEKYPKNYISTAIFNCQNIHYSVYYGFFDTNIEIICVMQGGHIPEYAFKEL